MSADNICSEKYYPKGDDWHEASCDKPAKFRLTGIGRWAGPPPGPRHVCGVHVRFYRKRADHWRVEPIR